MSTEATNDIGGNNLVNELSRSHITRRSLLAGGLGLAGAATLGRFGGRGRPAALARPFMPASAADAGRAKVYSHLLATDGWVYMPYGGGAATNVPTVPGGAPDNPPFFPDGAAPAPYNTYVFGFRDVTALDGGQLNPNLADPLTPYLPYKGHAQISAPILGFDEDTDIYVTLTNLGLQQRPDLVDGHTLHWHGFQNAIPLFDGVPELSFSVPISRSFQYFYRPHHAGTYMYHCHFEDVEHVQMGMTGMVYIRPSGWTAADKFAYNTVDAATGAKTPIAESRYDREFSIFLTEIWSEAHYRDAHIQTNDWTDYNPSFWLLNGRAYPDTVQPGGYDPTASTLPAGVQERLRYQPNSALVTCNAGDKVLLRIASLGYQNAGMLMDGIDVKLIAKDSNPLIGRDGTANFQSVNTVEIGPGESRDVIFTAPNKPGDYYFYNRNLAHRSNGGARGLGGQITIVRVYAAGTLPAQTKING